MRQAWERLQAWLRVKRMSRRESREHALRVVERHGLTAHRLKPAFGVADDELAWALRRLWKQGYLVTEPGRDEIVGVTAKIQSEHKTEVESRRAQIRLVR